MSKVSSPGRADIQESSLANHSLAQKHWRAAVLIHGVGIGMAWIFRTQVGQFFHGFAPLHLWMICIEYVILCMVIGAIWHNNKWTILLSSRQFAISTLLAVTVFGLLGTAIKQDPAVVDFTARIGLRSIFPGFPPFVMSSLLMLLNLGIVVGRRASIAHTGYIGFLISHGGMLLVVIAMIGSTLISKTAFLVVGEGKTANTLVFQNGSTMRFRWQVKLNRFEIEKYPPRLAMVELTANPLARDYPGYRMHQDHEWAVPGHLFTAYGYTMRVMHQLVSASMNKEGEWQVAPKEIGTSAVQVEIADAQQRRRRGWVAAGNDAVGLRQQYLQLDERHLLALFDSPPKAFRSVLRIQQPGQHAYQAVLAVNKPLRIGQWLLYQNSYQVRNQHYVSIVEAVNDPTLPMVYLGMLLLFVGSVLQCWHRKSTLRSHQPVEGE